MEFTGVNGQWSMVNEHLEISHSPLDHTSNDRILMNVGHSPLTIHY
ncbi:MAG: hypothetical protein ACXWV0_02810 [Flavisolibacter sp.]